MVDKSEPKYPDELATVLQAAEVAGSKTALAKILAARGGQPLTVSAVSQWGRRSPIPRWARRELLTIIERGIVEASDEVDIPDPVQRLGEAQAGVLELFKRTHGGRTLPWRVFEKLLESLLTAEGR